ncbi:MAG: hypothetical protein R6W94_01205, partial [Spirochaetia bacterium]
IREGEALGPDHAPDHAPDHGDDVLARVPAEFAAAPRYLLLPRGTRSVVAAGMHPIGERRRPSLAPVLSGVRHPRGRLRTLVVANLLVALALVAAAVTASTSESASHETGGPRTAAAGARAPGGREAGGGGARTAGAGTGAVGTAPERGVDAAAALEALGRTLEPLSPRLHLREIRAEGGALRLRATGGDAESVRAALEASRDFENVVTVARRERGFVIEARYRGRRYPARRHRVRSEPTATPSDTGGARAAALLEDAGAEGIAFERIDTAGGTRTGTGTGIDTGTDARYRIYAEASADATAEALVGFTAAEHGIPVAAFSLTRTGRVRWRMTAVVSNGEVAEE